MPEPEVGTCHALSLEQATEPSAAETEVSCGVRHTSVTVAVRPLDLIDDGHLLDVGSADAAGFERVCCGQPHRWRAVGIHDFTTGSRHVGDSATAALQARCEDLASSRSPGAPELTWASEWPTRAQWDAGQRWGWCRVPSQRTG